MAESPDLSEALEALRDPDWVTGRLKAATRTPGKKRTEIRLVIESPHVTDHSNVQRVEIAQRLFSRLDAKGRTRFWENLFPHLAPHIERAWGDAASRPYPSGSSPAPFRAPNRDSVASENRARFVVEVCDALRGLNPDAEWLAAWAPHLSHAWWGSNGMGWLLSAVLRGGGADGDAVRSVLMDSMNGEHEIGVMGRHVSRHPKV